MSIITAPGVTEFLDLADAPHSYSGQTGKVVKVNAGETAVEFGVGGGGGEQVAITVSSSQSVDTNQVVLANAIDGSITITINTPSTEQTVTIKKIDSSSNSVYVTNSLLIDGDSIAELSMQNESITLKYNGSTFYII